MDPNVAQPTQPIQPVTPEIQVSVAQPVSPFNPSPPPQSIQSVDSPKKTNKAIGILVILFILLTLILSPIAGLIGVVLMWWKTNWSKAIKIALTVLFLIVCVINYFAIETLISYHSAHTPFAIKGDSMSPNYKDGSYYLSNNYSSSVALKQGDVIIFHGLGGVSGSLDKRIIGLPGDKILLKDGDVYLNGEKLTENYVTGRTYPGDFMKEGQEIKLCDLVPGVQVRPLHNNYIVASPSTTHAKPYKWFQAEEEQNYSPFEMQIALCPDWLYKIAGTSARSKKNYKVPVIEPRA